MRIRDAITRPAFLVTASVLALSTAIAIVGSSAPARDSLDDRGNQPEDLRPLPPINFQF